MAKASILVIGANGQLARSLAAAKPPDGCALHCAARPQTDLTQPQTLKAALDCHDPALVINAAAYTQVDKAESEPDLAFAVNAEGPGALAQACAQADIPLIHVSTDYVYDGKKNSPYDEADIPAPMGVYGRSKLAGEDRVRKAGGRHLILRTAWVYSPWGSNFVKTMLRLADERDELGVVADQFGCPTYAPHLADAVMELSRQIVSERVPDDAWGVYCAAGSGETSWHGFAEDIFAQSARLKGPVAAVKPIPTSAYPTPAQRPANSRLNCARLQKRFGLRLPHWKEGAAACVKAILESA